MSRKIGVLGGTFNPIHYGHLASAEEIRERLGLDLVLFIPSFLPPHKHEEDMPPASQRLDMTRIAVSGNPFFEVSDIEIRRGGRSYTIDTIEALLKEHPGAEIYFITGIDSFLEIRTWHEWKMLLTLCSFVVLSRPGYRFAELGNIDFMKGAARELDDLDSGKMRRATVHSEGIRVCLETIPLYDISSTDIRRRIKQGRSVKYHLPETVETYIIENKLYA